MGIPCCRVCNYTILAEENRESGMCDGCRDKIERIELRQLLAAKESDNVTLRSCVAELEAMVAARDERIERWEAFGEAADELTNRSWDTEAITNEYLRIRDEAMQTTTSTPTGETRGS